MATDKSIIVNIGAGESLVVLEDWGVQKLTFRGTNSDGLSMSSTGIVGAGIGGGTIVESDTTSGYSVVSNSNRVLSGITITSVSGTGTGDVVMQA
jgi:hypothetical protein